MPSVQIEVPLPWKVKQAAETEFPHRYKEIALQPLSEAGSRELVDELLAISELPPRLHELIRDKAEGNPFFVEEVIRTLIDSGAVIRDEVGARWTENVLRWTISIFLTTFRAC